MTNAADVYYEDDEDTKYIIDIFTIIGKEKLGTNWVLQSSQHLMWDFYYILYYNTGVLQYP